MTASDARQQRYTAVAIALHWLIALAIVGMIALGWYMTGLPTTTTAERGQQFTLFQLHKSIGVTILLLSVARVVWRLMNPPPPEPPMPGWQAGAQKAVHVFLYILIIVMPLSGWIMVSASPTGIDTILYKTVQWPHLPGLSTLPLETRQQLREPLEFVHSKLAWVIIVLLGLHVAGALKHQFIDKDHLLARMWPGLFGRTGGPPRKGKGGLIAFGAAILLFGVVAGAGLIGGANSSSAAPPPASDAARASPAPVWTVDPAKSAIVFKGAYMGRPFQGKFANWTSTIQFDPDKPETARIRVVVKTASAATGEPYFDDSLKEGDWFDISKTPDAVFEVNEGVLKDGPTQYEATGVLTLKGVRYPLRLPFTLEIAGKTAKMHGETSLKRLAMGIGKGTPAEKPAGDAEWVQDDVALVVDVVASRQ
jgi:cytochrome b561